MTVQVVVVSKCIRMYTYVHKFKYKHAPKPATHCNTLQHVHRCHQSQRQEPQQQSTWFADLLSIYIYTYAYIHEYLYTHIHWNKPVHLCHQSQREEPQQQSTWLAGRRVVYVYICMHVYINIYTLKQTCPSLPPVATRGASAAVHMACRWSWCPERLNTHCELSPSLLPHHTFIGVMSHL